MISNNEAILMLKVSPPTFYRWLKKLDIELVIKKGPKGKSSFIKNEDLETMASAMGKSLYDTEQRSGDEDKLQEGNVPYQSNQLLQEINELKLSETKLNSKVEEFSGYVKIYQEQSKSMESKIVVMEEERKALFTQVLEARVKLGNYQVMFYALGGAVVLFSVLFLTGVIQMGNGTSNAVSGGASITDNPTIEPIIEKTETGTELLP